MLSSMRLPAARTATVATSALAAFLAVVAVAFGYVTTDMNNWNLTTSTSTYGGGTNFHVSAGTDGQVSYRWLDLPNVGTVISAHGCTDGSSYGSSSYGVNDTSYHTLFYGFQGQCFLMRGRTTSGSLFDHDGRVRR